MQDPVEVGELIIKLTVWKKTAVVDVKAQKTVVRKQNLA